VVAEQRFRLVANSVVMAGQAGSPRGSLWQAAATFHSPNSAP